MMVPKDWYGGVEVVDIATMRIKRRLTQKELSELSGVPQQTISAIETGARRDPGASTLAMIAKALKCTVDDLIVDE